MIDKPIRYEFICHPYQCELLATPDVSIDYKIYERDISLRELVSEFRNFLIASGFHPDSVGEYING